MTEAVEIDRVIELLEMGGQGRHSDMVNLVAFSSRISQKEATAHVRHAIESLLNSVPGMFDRIQSGSMLTEEVEAAAARFLANDQLIRQWDIPLLVDGQFRASQSVVDFLKKEDALYKPLETYMPDELAEKTGIDKESLIRLASLQAVRLHGAKKIGQLWKKDKGKVVEALKDSIALISANAGLAPISDYSDTAAVMSFLDTQPALKRQIENKIPAKLASQFAGNTTSVMLEATMRHMRCMVPARQKTFWQEETDFIGAAIVNQIAYMNDELETTGKVAGSNSYKSRSDKKPEAGR